MRAASDVEVADFFMGRYPVTNREYLRFAEVSGYRDPAYREHPFVLDGDTLSWCAAMARFTHRTGRHVPRPKLIRESLDCRDRYLEHSDRGADVRRPA